MGVCTSLSRHLQLLHLRDTIARVENDDFGTWHIGKTSHGCLTSITRSGGQDDNFIFQAVFLGRSGHKVRQDGESHVLEGNGRSSEELQIVLTLQFDQGCNFRRVELVIVGIVDTVVQLLSREIIQEG